jgi:hypothetical protein
MTTSEARVPAWLRRAILLLLLGAAALFIAFWLVIRLRSLIVTLLVSLFLAFAMEPAANFLARRGWRRGLATAAVFAALVAAILVFVTALGSLLVGQISDLVDALPGYARQVADFLNQTFGANLDGSKLTQQLQHNQGVRDFVNGVAAAAVGLPPRSSGWCCRASPSGCSPSTWSPTDLACAARSARCCDPSASSSRCGSGTWRSRAPVATCTPGPCWPAYQPPRPGSP